MSDLEKGPQDFELDAIDAEYNHGLTLFPLDTDTEKGLDDWVGLIAQYAMLALSGDTPDEVHNRLIQSSQLAIRAARAIRTGDIQPLVQPVPVEAD